MWLCVPGKVLKIDVEGKLDHENEEELLCVFPFRERCWK